MSGAAHCSQDWGHGMRHTHGFPSVNVFLMTKLLSHDPLSWDMDCLLTLWPLLISCFFDNGCCMVATEWNTNTAEWFESLHFNTCFLQLLYFISLAQQPTGQVAKHYDSETIQCSFPMGTNRGFLAEHLVCKNVQPWLRVSFASTFQPSLYLVPYISPFLFLQVLNKRLNTQSFFFLVGFFFFFLPEPVDYKSNKT